MNTKVFCRTNRENEQFFAKQHEHEENFIIVSRIKLFGKICSQTKNLCFYTKSIACHPRCETIQNGELDPAEGVHRRCKKNSSVLSCIGKRTREGCDCGSIVGTVHNGQDRERSSSSKKIDEIWQKREL